MALIYKADLRPSKLELLRSWLPARSWFHVDPDVQISKVAAFRFDDPAGRVGIETLLIRAGGDVLQVPLTYRDAPLDSAEPWLIGTMEHSVLGTRWTYDATGDPVYLAAVSDAIRLEGRQADEYVDVDGVPTLREPDAVVVGSGGEMRLATGTGQELTSHVDDTDMTAVAFSSITVIVHRRPNAAVQGLEASLTGTWPGQSVPQTLVRIE